MTACIQSSNGINSLVMMLMSDTMNLTVSLSVGRKSAALLPGIISGLSCKNELVQKQNNLKAFLSLPQPWFISYITYTNIHAPKYDKTYRANKQQYKCVLNLIYASALINAPASFSKIIYINFHEFLFASLLGAPIDQWVMRWLTDLAVKCLSLARGKIFSTVNRVPLHTAFHYHPPIVLISLKYCKIATHPTIHLFTSLVWLVAFQRWVYSQLAPLEENSILLELIPTDPY